LKDVKAQLIIDKSYTIKPEHNRLIKGVVSDVNIEIEIMN
jgi:hypothetical protein